LSEEEELVLEEELPDESELLEFEEPESDLAAPPESDFEPPPESFLESVEPFLPTVALDLA
jgi:hypothetical protein